MTINEPDPREVDRVFDVVCRRPVEERAAALDDEGVSPPVRRIVEALLAHFDEPDPELDGDVRGLTLPPSVVSRPDVVGPYAIVDTLGSGGMGVVYLAEQQSPRRYVAVKILHPGLLDGEGVARFEREAQLLGRLQHPGIAQIFESGVADGQTYIAMEYVEGVPLAEYVKREQLDRDACLELLIQLSASVHHAHLRGVVHRDLKSSNVLVTGEGVVKVIDFGVARTTDREQATLHTRTGQIVGTLAYMSPEQVRGDPDRIDARADVYALGALSFEVLTGRLPHVLRDLSITAAAKNILEKDPPRVGDLNPLCRGDVELIVAKALAKEPERRFQSAAGLADDIRRFLNHESIEARPTSVSYQIRRLVRRHRVAAAGVTATLVSILAGASVATHYAVKNSQLANAEAEARRKADDKADEALRLAEKARVARDDANEQAQAAQEAQRVAEQAARDLEVTAAFTEDTVRDVQPEQLGQEIVRALEQELAAATDGPMGLSAEERVGLLRELVGAVNPTDVGSRLLYGSIYEPMLKEIDRRLTGRPELHVRMLVGVATELTRRGYLIEAEKTLRHAVEVSAALPEEHFEALSARFRLGVALLEQNRSAEARELIGATAEVCVATLPENSFLTVSALNGLALSHLREGDFEAAESLFRPLLEHMRGAEPGDARADAVRVATGFNLWTVLDRMDRRDDMARLWEEERDYVATSCPQIESVIQAAKAGEAIPESLLAYRHEALTMLVFTGNAARYRNDEDLNLVASRASWRLSRELHGDRSAYTYPLGRALADVLIVREEYGEAEDILREVLPIYREELPAGHADTAMTETHLGHALFGQGKYHEALPWLEEGLMRIEEGLVPDVDLEYVADLLVRTYEALAEEEPGAGYDESARSLTERLGLGN